MPVVGLARDLGILWVSGTRREHRAPKGARAWSLLPSKSLRPSTCDAPFEGAPPAWALGQCDDLTVTWART